ncbi:polyprenyl synthetase family protein [Arcanobacterium buesumense]|uniref:Polyprenyl synthetase family protein n=1 Tax=Arcanobacterium buesumense TaxID=2722751 RepID=A0A6H2EL15_9ACTO|nr:polyprenyl synthetase family protein [Arcanobacterium buesumense]QJC21679.1 polyprenyl synthetase family protein [Arcanobacterium buesumense]
MVFSNFRDAVSARLIALLTATPSFIEDPRGKELFAEFIEPAQLLSSGGKRIRALCVAGGYQTIAPTARELPLPAAVAVELYQASALVHDDIIDAADTRRGISSAHRLFERVHNTHSFTGQQETFGHHAGLLLGDYLLSLAGEEFARQDATDHAYRRATSLFHAMSAETAFGQYMDMRAEFTAVENNFQGAITDAFLVLLHKSARYSIELPVLLGAALAGANDADLAQLSLVTRPLGEAFQLRDDELGIFGEPSITGKPAGSDITEGKRTVLLALTRSLCSPTERAFIDDHLGQSLNNTEVAKIKEIIHSSGAYQQHEKLISEREDRALAQMPENAGILRQLATELMDRRF